MLEAEAGTSSIFETLVASMQEDVVVGDNAITGTLKKLSSGPIADYWGEGNFIALKVTELPEGAEPSDIKIGLNNPVALDDDLNGVWKVASNEQTLKVIYGDDIKEYDLSGLTLLS